MVISIIPSPTPPGGSPRSRSSTPGRKSPRSPFDFAERGLDSITAREVQEALARGIQRRDMIEQREALYADYGAMLERGAEYDSVLERRDEYESMLERRDLDMLEDVY